MDEVVEMGRKELNRHHVIRNVLEGKASQVQAAQVLRLSERQVRRLCGRVRTQGARGVLHGLKGRPSNHQLDQELVEKALCALHDPLWERFGPTFAGEKLKELHAIAVDPETLRKLMTQVDLWLPKHPKARHRAWRERRTCIGMLVQLDGSDHDWLEGRGPRFVLLAYIDDATSQILYAEFIPVEDTVNLLRVTQKYLKRFGRPVAYYVDKDSIYKVNQAHETLRDPITQFTRGMNELGIEVICAETPQAKGRVERTFQTHQDRLVKELRLRGISTMAEANHYLWQTYIPAHNARFAVAPADASDAHRPLLEAHRLEQILSVRTERTLMNDYTLRHENKFLQVLEHQSVRVMPGDKIDVELRLDGSTHLRFKGTYLNFKTLDKRPYRPHLLAQPSRTKQYGIPSLHGANYRPAKDHPWRILFSSGPYRTSLASRSKPF